jgi:hypothetical protein
MKMTLVVLFLVSLTLTGCAPGKQVNHEQPTTVVAGLNTPLDSSPDASGTVVKARAFFKVSTGSEKLSLMNWIFPRVFADSIVQEPVTTVLAASTNFALDDSLFAVPTSPTAFAVNDFGYLRIGTLKDNNLNVCGPNGDTHCRTAKIRIYTSGTPGAGLWNSADQYGAPVTAGQIENGLAPIGLELANATTLQQTAISEKHHVVVLEDFPNAKYDFQVDFTQAGAGTYSTTVVLEYVLTP